MKLTEIIQELVKSLANRGNLEISAIVVKTSQNEDLLEIPGIPETADETDSDFVNYPDPAPSAAEAALSDYHKKFRDHLSDSISDAKELLQAEKEPQNNPTQPPPAGSGFVNSTDNASSDERAELDDFYKEVGERCFARLLANKQTEKEAQNKPYNPHKDYRDYFARLEANSEEKLSKGQHNAGYHKINKEPAKPEVKAKARVNMVTNYETLAQIHYLYTRPVELNTESIATYPDPRPSVVTHVIVFKENGYPNTYEIPKNGRFELFAL